MALVSVIVPFYNQLRFLQQGLESVRDQTHTEWELILVDDGSFEDPIDLVQSLGDERIRVIKQKNAGVANARNTAIEKCRGEYLVFLDADDWIAPTMLDRLSQILDSHPTVGMAYCDITRVDQDGRVADSHRIIHARAQLNGNILPSLLLGGYFPPVCAMTRTSVMDKVGGFDQSLGGCCDWDLWIRIAASGFEAQFLPEQLAFYRIHDQSMSKDAEHMRSTAEAALAKNMAAFPQQLAASMQLLVQTSAEMYSENASRIAEKQYLDGKLTECRAEVIHLGEVIASLKSEIDSLSKGKEWVDQQRLAYKADCENKQLAIDSLTEGKQWLEQQWKAYMADSERKQQLIDSLLAKSGNN